MAKRRRLIFPKMGTQVTSLKIFTTRRTVLWDNIYIDGGFLNHLNSAFHLNLNRGSEKQIDKVEAFTTDVFVKSEAVVE